MFASRTSPALARRRLVLASSLLLGLAPLAGQAADAAFPSKPITLIVPYPAGGANDAVGRIVGQKMGEILKQSVIVDNRAGAGTTIGTALAAKAPADGYTLVLGSLSSHAISPHLYRQPGYDAIKDFAPVGMIGEAPIVLEVATDSPFKDVKQIVAQAKSKPATLTYGSAGNGSPLHLSAELFKRAANVDMTHVPYKGGAPAVMALMGGEIAMMFSDYVSLQPHLASGKVKIIAVTGLRRSRLTPQVPTMAELGYTGFEAVGWGGVFAPAKTPPHIVQQLAAAVTAAVRDPAVSAKLGEMGYEPGGVPTAEFASQVKSDHALWTGLIRRAGARLD